MYTFKTNITRGKVLPVHQRMLKTNLINQRTLCEFRGMYFAPQRNTMRKSEYCVFKCQNVGNLWKFYLAPQ